MVPKIYSVVALAALMCVCSCSKSERYPSAAECASRGSYVCLLIKRVSNDMFISPLDEPENLEELKQLYKQYGCQEKERAA